MPTKLSDTQLVVLSQAAQREDGLIILPDRLKGGAAEKLLTALEAKELIESQPEHNSFTDGSPGLKQPVPGATDFRISQAGLAALGLEREEGAHEGFSEADLAGERAAGAPAKYSAPATTTAPTLPSTKSPRSGSKLVEVIALLQRSEGASLDELTSATGWLSHTARAALTGLRKRGLAVSRSKRADGVSCYVLPAADTGSATADGNSVASDQQSGPEVA
ncbi:MAG TPA: DUF3489 domain-containing protein [Mesorhizobium sp.]|jgi:hypothetical protein|nr:DUF3489 domain-containing protein [Mesorhizobium sp.]